MVVSSFLSKHKSCYRCKHLYHSSRPWSLNKMGYWVCISLVKALFWSLLESRVSSVLVVSIPGNAWPIFRKRALTCKPYETSTEVKVIDNPNLHCILPLHLFQWTSRCTLWLFSPHLQLIPGCVSDNNVTLLVHREVLSSMVEALPFFANVSLISNQDDNDILSTFCANIVNPFRSIHEWIAI